MPFQEKISQPVKSEHLKEGVRPIVACVGTPEQFRQNPSTESEALEISGHGYGVKFWETPGVHNVDYDGDSKDLRSQGFKNAGEATYVISTVDGLDKFSGGFKNCTGVVVAGTDKKTGENISFLTHEDPAYFLNGKDNKKGFTKDLRERLEELRKRSVEGTIDAVMVGGSYFHDDPRYIEDYRNSIQLLSAEVSKVLGFEPTVMTGPKVDTTEADAVFYDNKNKRLYIIREHVGKASTQGFSPKDLGEQEQKW